MAKQFQKYVCLELDLIQQKQLSQLVDEVTMAPGWWEESGQMHLATREEESRKVWICAQIT